MKISKVEHNKKLLYKGLIGCVGIATGLGLSTVPGVGIIRMSVAAVKLTTSGINFWSKKHQNGVVAKVKNKSVNQIKEKCPKIYKTVRKINEMFKNEYLEVFLNGISIGYLAGNIFEINNIGGNSIAKGDVSTNVEVPESDMNISGTDNLIDDPPQDILSSLPDEPIQKGDTIDISSLKEGQVSSYSTEYVPMITEAGKDAIVEQFNTVNGVEKVHFIQSNGLDYGWFDLEEVKKIVKDSKVVENIIKKKL